MKKAIFFLSILSLIIFASCSNDNDPVSPNQGHWIGTFTGNGDNGTFDMNVAANGQITGTCYSLVENVTFNCTGTVNSSGQVSVTAGTTSIGSAFSGTMNGSTANGTWINNINTSYYGTWTGTKQ